MYLQGMCTVDAWLLYIGSCNGTPLYSQKQIYEKFIEDPIDNDYESLKALNSDLNEAIDSTLHGLRLILLLRKIGPRSQKDASCYTSSKEIFLVFTKRLYNVIFNIQI